jgi:diadenosine tetraphosphatase ApaH/serine/threonine PP2A family protein phosphatase
MRYAIFSDVHANLEALEATLAKLDEIAKDHPIDQLWCLGDLVGYGPDPNRCIELVRERTDVIIAGNHDWAAIGKLDLEEFSDAARISAEWTAKQLTDEHRAFLEQLPERLEIDGCTLVHGSPYGPLWEYLTSEVFAERSFQHFETRHCFVGHTHIPAIFQQPETVANIPTHPLEDADTGELPELVDDTVDTGIERTQSVAALTVAAQAEAMAESEESKAVVTDHTENDLESESSAEASVVSHETGSALADPVAGDEASSNGYRSDDVDEAEATLDDEDDESESLLADASQLNSEIEELLELLGLSRSMIQVTNTMIIPPEGHWDAPEDHRFIMNPGGVGQPRDGDPRAAFMIYDTETGCEFYRVAYDIQKTQEKIIKAGLPQYLAIRLAFGR